MILHCNIILHCIINGLGSRAGEGRKIPQDNEIVAPNLKMFYNLLYTSYLGHWSTCTQVW